MIGEDMNQVLAQVKNDIFRDLRVASIASVVNVHDKKVDVKLLVSDVSNGVAMEPPMIKNLNVVGGSMPDVGALGVVLHFDRKNHISSDMQESGGPAHEIGYGVFLSIVT